MQREVARLPRSLTGIWDRLQSHVQGRVRLGKLANEFHTLEGGTWALYHLLINSGELENRAMGTSTFPLPQCPVFPLRRALPLCEQLSQFQNGTLVKTPGGMNLPSTHEID